MKETIIEGQSIVDLSIKVYGSANGIIQLLKDNPAIDNLTVDLVPGFNMYWELATDTFEQTGVNYSLHKKAKRNVVVSENQNLIDLCVQEYGSAEGLLNFVKQNNLLLDEDMVPGANYTVEANEIIDIRYQSVFEKRRVNSGYPISDERIFDYTFDLTFN